MQGKPTSIRGLLSVATAWLSERGVEEPRLDTELLLSHVLGLRRLDLYLDHDRPLVASELERFRALMRRRGEGREPVAYLIGRRGFHGIDLQVGPAVLIPRPDTEHLVEVGEAYVDERGGSLRFADVGTGSGCVALALAHARDSVRGVAIDLSGAALDMARANAQELGLTDRVAFVRGDLLAPLRAGSLDLVLSNPPYVLESERSLMAPEVLAHEPSAALFDAEGLPLTRRLVAQAATALVPGGLLAIETGFDKADLVASFLAAEGFEGIERTRDLGGIERVVSGRRQGAETSR